MATLRWRAAVDRPRHEVHQPLMDLDVGEPAAVRRRIRHEPEVGTWHQGRVPVLPLAGSQHDLVAAVRGQADDLEPAVSIGHVQE